VGRRRKGKEVGKLENTQVFNKASLELDPKCHASRTKSTLICAHFLNRRMESQNPWGLRLMVSLQTHGVSEHMGSRTTAVWFGVSRHKGTKTTHTTSGNQGRTD
jgi:hypothetical protein